ncbi:unnamed protein product [Vicia faba]|uniref:Uncharacterized protein n=1 Tax=Vicia faba TaxID=3906 RepID=A0AAV0YFS1_VICFA|nr:unnamed protein product [Vicia faba]
MNAVMQLSLDPSEVGEGRGADLNALALFGSCVEKIPKSSINSDLKICDKDHGHRRVLFGYKYVMLLVIIVIFITAVLMCRSFRIQRANKLQKCQKEASKKMETSIFSQVDIDADEISHLDEDNLIGHGGNGKVYRITLKKNRMVVVVKQLEKGDG